MESSYGIGVTNRYALFFDNEEDPLEVLKIQEQEKEAKKKTKVSEKENKGKPEATKGKPAQADRKGIKETQNVKTQPQPKPKEALKPKEQQAPASGRPQGQPRAPRGEGNERPAYRNDRNDRTDRNDRPERGDRSVKFSGETREERNNRFNREDRPSFQTGDWGRDRGERGGDRGDRGGDRGDRGDRGGDRGGERGFGDRGFGDRGDRSERGFGERGFGGDRGDRGGDRPDRGDRGGDRPDRGERGFGNRGFGERADRVERDGPREEGDRPFRGRGGFRGGLRGRGGPRPPYDNRGKREFDRQSGSDRTGVKAVDKKDGGGAHNWGNHHDDIEEANQSNQWNSDNAPQDKAEDPANESGELKDADRSQNADGSTPEKPTGTDKAEGDEMTAAEEAHEMTLDEWKAMQGIRQKPQYNLRKAGEGEDPSQWKKMHVLQKKKPGEEDEEDDEEVEYDAADYPQRVGRQKHVLDIEFVFGDTRRGGRGRGRGSPRGMGRGRIDSRGPPRDRGDRDRGDRGDRERGDRERGDRDRGDRDYDRDAPRGGPSGSGMRRDYNRPAGGPAVARPPKVDDEHDFPSLG